MATRGVRGAIQVSRNDQQQILKATKKLVQMMLQENAIAAIDIASIIFTTTNDLNAEFPALAARQMGLVNVPLLCAREIDVPSSMERVVRVLILINTEKKQSEIRHCYPGETSKLRLDQGESKK
ncbi:MAG: chorismate mutase [candidate division Zixibacteria bacterium CG_4_9_14_3_um_filter_46_8]|nr:MAG: chorismate mutase [candidate division Zixibacteria bacterium CG_4_9_14_3_um_filter_46_8]